MQQFLVYYPDVCLQLNMFRAVFVVGPAGRPDHEHSTTATTIRG